MKLKHAYLMTALLVVGVANTAFAKLPAPSDEAKEKAAQAAAKTAWTGKVDGHLLCKSQDKAAAHYYKTNKTAKKPAKATTPPCADPGPFVYPLPVVAAVVASATPAAATPAAAKSATTTKPAAAVAPAKKP